MSFLFPIALLGLLSLAVPLILHFIKKAEVQEMDWAAMEFLQVKEARSMRRKSLKNLLLLLSRLAVLAFMVIALARPIGNFFSLGKDKADSILILFDRSAEMAGQLSPGNSFHDIALDELKTALQGYQSSTRVYLLDSATLELVPVLSPDNLEFLAQTSLVDTPTSILQMLSTAGGVLERGEFGKTEFWVVSSDLEAAWEPRSSSWASVQDLVPDGVQVRPFTYETMLPDDLSITLLGTKLVQSQLELEVEVFGGSPGQIVPLNGAWQSGEKLVSEIEIQKDRTRYLVPLMIEEKTDSGSLSLATDDNPNNNTIHFAYGPPIDVRSLIVTDERDSLLTNYLLRSVALSSRPNQKATWIAPKDLTLTDLSNYDLVVWAANAEGAEERVFIESYVAEGGNAVIFPAPDNETHVKGWFFDKVSEAPIDDFFTIESWRQKDGPWRNADSGNPLPIAHVQGIFVAETTVEGSIMATWSNEQPALIQKFVGSGRLYLLSTLPMPTWSNLENLALHLILVQRVLEGESSDEGGYLQSLVAGKAPYLAELQSQGDRALALNRARVNRDNRIERRAIAKLLDKGELSLASAGKRPMRPWMQPLLYLALLLLIGEAVVQQLPENFGQREERDA